MGGDALRTKTSSTSRCLSKEEDEEKTENLLVGSACDGEHINSIQPTGHICFL